MQKRNWLSALMAVMMVISMMTCFAVPTVIAEEVDLGNVPSVQSISSAQSGSQQYKIETVEDLIYAAKNYKFYTAGDTIYLANDLDIATYDGGFAGEFVGFGENHDSNKGTTFMADFDGLGHTIYNYEDTHAIFRGKGGILRNLNIVDANMNAAAAGALVVAAADALGTTTISNVHIYNSTITAGDVGVAMLLGFTNNKPTRHVLIENCSVINSTVDTETTTAGSSLVAVRFRDQSGASLTLKNIVVAESTLITPNTTNAGGGLVVADCAGRGNLAVLTFDNIAVLNCKLVNLSYSCAGILTVGPKYGGTINATNIFAAGNMRSTDAGANWKKLDRVIDYTSSCSVILGEIRNVVTDVGVTNVVKSAKSGVATIPNENQTTGYGAEAALVSANIFADVGGYTLWGYDGDGMIVPADAASSFPYLITFEIENEAYSFGTDQNGQIAIDETNKEMLEDYDWLDGFTGVDWIIDWEQRYTADHLYVSGKHVFGYQPSDTPGMHWKHCLVQGCQAHTAEEESCTALRVDDKLVAATYYAPSIITYRCTFCKREWSAEDASSISPAPVTVQSDKAVYVPGNEMSVSIVTKEDAGIAALSATVTYDSQQLSLVSCAGDTGNSEWSESERGTVKLAAVGLDGESTLTLSFTLTDRLIAPESVITVKLDAISDANENILLPRTEEVSTSFEVTEEVFEYSVSDGEATITGYIGNDTEIVIPSTVIKGGVEYPVTALGAKLFYDDTSITSVIISDSVTTIGSYAFCYCKNLTSVTIGNGVTSIGDYAFKSCSSLISIIVPDRVTRIGQQTFYNCTSLTSITIPKGVTWIGNCAFRNCTSLTSITIPDSVTYIGYQVFYNCTSLTSITIPDSVTTSIGTEVFYGCTSLTSITLPDSVTTIGYYAFGKCTSLTSIALPDSVTSIGNNAFYNCYGLTSITIPGSVTSIGNWAFAYCSRLTSITIPEGVTTIGSNAFYYCTRLNSITISEGVTTIASNAFYNCYGLTSITIPASVTTIGSGAFSRCTSLAEIKLAEGNTAYCLEDGVLYNADRTELIFYPAQKPDATYTIPSTVTAIPSYAFYGCKNLTAVIIPEGVTSIGSSAFNGCTGLTAVYITDLSAWCNIGFSNQSSNPLNYRGGNLYLNGALITDLVIPDGVTSIGGYAFRNCINLTSVTLPESVTSIGDQAFCGCSGLTSVTISEGVTTIASNAFHNCYGLTSITIPASVTSIYNTAFSCCTALAEIKLAEGNTAYCIEDGVLYNADKTELICYPAQKPDATYTIPSTVTAIPSYAFYGCKNLTAVIIPEGVTSIGSCAFYDCTDLTSVTIPEGVTTIGSYAFGGCTGLTAITIPASVTTIGSDAFSRCRSLAEIKLAEGNTAYCVEDGVLYNTDKTELICYPAQKPDSTYVISSTVTDIPSCAFYGCKNLIAVTIPEGVTTIGYDAFCNCKNLTSIAIPASVTTIGSGAFLHCTSLAEIKLAEENTAYCLEDGVLYNADKTELICYPAQKPDTTYAVSSTVTAILNNAFYGCQNLTAVTIPEGVTSIGAYAFCGCSGLAEILVEAESVEYCAVDGILFNKEMTELICYPAAKDLVAYTVPNSVSIINSGAFSGCTGLTSVTIPDSITTIGSYAFENCSNLEVAYVLNKEASIKNKAFPETTIILHELPEISWEYTVKDSAITITGYEGNAVVLEVPAFMEVDGAEYPVIAINSAVFQGETELKKILLPETLTTIGSFAFSGCTGLTAVELPENVSVIGRYAFADCSGLATITVRNPHLTFGANAYPESTEILYEYPMDPEKPHLTVNSTNINLAVFHTAGLKATRVYWGYAGTEAIETQDWNTFTAAVPSAIRNNDFNPVDGENYVMTNPGYYLFWVQYTDAKGEIQNICHTVRAWATLDENYGKPYLAFDESGKVAWMNTNGTTVQKMYWGYIGDTDYKYSTWDEFCTRVRANGSYLPDYGVKDGEGYVVNEAGYYRFVIVYLDAQGQRQERYFTIKAETPATAPSMDNSTLSNVATFINEEGYTAKTYYGYIGEENTKYVDFNTFKATATDFTTDFGTPAGKAFKLTKAGYWRFVINYTVNGATKDAVCTVYVDEADLALGTPKLVQSESGVTLDANGATVSKVYVGYIGIDNMEIDSWDDYYNNRLTNKTYYGPKDGTTFPLGTRIGQYTVVVAYNNGGAEQLAFYNFYI